MSWRTGQAIRVRDWFAFVGMVLPMLCVATSVAAAEQPLWEVGLGFAGVSFPCYRGSDQVKSYALPMAHVDYHGDVLKSDRHGVRGVLFDSGGVDLNVSFAMSPPATSNGNRARSGMPDISATVEAGPQLDVVLWRTENHARFLKLQIPLRAAYTLEHHPKQVGWVSNPRVNLDVTDLADLPGWNMGLLAGPMFGDARQNEYFYSVAPAYATAQRPAYEARAGYAGMQYLFSVTKRFPSYWVGAFARYDNLSHAVFEDSPLVRQKDYVALGFAVTWILGRSSTMVAVDE